MKLQKRIKHHSVPVYHTSWGKLPLDFLLKLGFKFNSHREIGWDVFSITVGDYIVRVEDSGNDPILTIDGVVIASLRNFRSKKQFINLIKSALQNPAKLVQFSTYYWTDVYDYFSEAWDKQLVSKASRYFKHSVGNLRKELHVKIDMKAFNALLEQPENYFELEDILTDFFLNIHRHVSVPPRWKVKETYLIPTHPVHFCIVKFKNYPILTQTMYKQHFDLTD